MKKQINNYLLILLCIHAVNAGAQSNTFPASGNVGIGTTTPAAKLEVWGGGAEIFNGWLKLTHNTPYGDVNDGKIGNSLFAQGLNIVGINNDNTSRKIQLWGGITQNENGGGNAFTGYTTFNGTVDVVSESGLRLVHSTPYGDGNDGKICNSQFAQGLNIVGINNDNTYRKIQVWGGITQNQNDGGNFFAGNSSFGQKVVIGNVSQPAGYSLFVEQGILAEKVKVAVKTSADWADHVFAENYNLMPLEQVAEYIRRHKHLPGMPSAEKLVAEGGIDVNRMFAKQMEKIEELTLYIIAQQERMYAMENEINSLKKTAAKQ